MISTVYFTDYSATLSGVAGILDSMWAVSEIGNSIHSTSSRQVYQFSPHRSAYGGNPLYSTVTYTSGSGRSVMSLIVLRKFRTFGWALHLDSPNNRSRGGSRRTLLGSRTGRFGAVQTGHSCQGSWQIVFCYTMIEYSGSSRRLPVGVSTSPARRSSPSTSPL